MAAYDLAARRGARILALEARMEVLRATITDLRDMVDERDEIIVGLREEVEQRDARIDELERAAYGADW